MPLLEELVCPLVLGEVEGEEELAVDSSADGVDSDVAGLSAESSLLEDFLGLFNRFGVVALFKFGDRLAFGFLWRGGFDGQDRRRFQSWFVCFTTGKQTGNQQE